MFADQHLQKVKDAMRYQRHGIARQFRKPASPAMKTLYGSHVIYGGNEIQVGAYEHWQLMRRACRAKFEQNADPRNALLGTGERPLIHVVKHDSRTIPGVIMASIWMVLRKSLRGAVGGSA
jgi:predicted NAD-dependent protein-ADP-ribosyltransferase YbiA (DUF1768 family)